MKISFHEQISHLRTVLCQHYGSIQLSDEKFYFGGCYSTWLKTSKTVQWSRKLPAQKAKGHSNKSTSGFPWVKRAGMRATEAHARPDLQPQYLYHKHPSRVVVTHSVICNLIKRFGDQISNLTTKWTLSVLRVCLVRHPATQQQFQWDSFHLG